MDLKTINNPFLYIPGGLNLRPSGDKLCYACRFLNTFSILNIADGTALQIYSNNEDLDTEAIADARKSSVYYSSATSTNDYLFLATSRGVDYDKIKEEGTSIEVYDWRGKHIHRFLTTNLIHYTSIDETGHNLYAVVEDTPSVMELPREILPIDRIFPTDMVAIDTFLLLMQHHEEKTIKVFSTNTCKFLGEFLRKGGGPNEVVTFGRASQWFMEAGEPKIVIQSYPNYLAVLNIRKSLEAKETVYDRKYTFDTDQGKHLFMASNSVYEYNQSELMMTKDPTRSGIKDNSNSFWEFYDYGKDKVNRKIVYENFTGLIDPFSKSSDRLLKPDHKKVALLYSMVNLISIVDIEKREIKQIYPEGKKLHLNENKGHL